MLLRDQRATLKKLEEERLASLPYSEVPSAVDMAPYAQFYSDIVRSIATKNGSMTVVEAGVRYGCSARIFIEALKGTDAWHLHLMDPEPKQEATVLQSNNHVTFHQVRAEQVASDFADQSIDLLHIDVDYDNTHPYELSFNVLLSYLRKLKADGEVIIHDCTEHFPGIVRLVEELKASGWEATHCEPKPECPIAAPVHLRQSVDIGRPEITVVVPVITNKWLPALLKNIRALETKPVNIIVVDNGGGVTKATVGKFVDLPITYLPRKTNIGVNASWNLGIAEAQTELVAILNDDIILPDGFFRAMQDTFMCYSPAGFVIPSTISPPLKIGSAAPWNVGEPTEIRCTANIPEVVSVPHRDGGWCMTVRKSLVEPIPSNMFTFCGDDALFRQIIGKGYWALRMLDTVIYHYVGVSQDVKMREKLKLPLTFQQERKEWMAILEKERVNGPD